MKRVTGIGGIFFEANDPRVLGDRRAAEAITDSTLAADLHFLASDELGGRITPSAGLDRATRSSADGSVDSHLRPAGDDGSYFRSVPVDHFEVDTIASFVEVNGRRFHSPLDFAAKFRSQ